MICEAINIDAMEKVIPNHGIALLAADWALDNLEGDAEYRIKWGARKIEKWINTIPRKESAVKSLLSDLEANKLIYKSKYGNQYWYKTNHDAIVSSILYNKTRFLDAGRGNLDLDSEFGEKPYLYFKAKNRFNRLSELNFQENPLELDKVGDLQLGITLLSKKGIVRPLQYNQTVDTISEKIASKVIQDGEISKTDVYDILNGYKNAFIDKYEEFKSKNSQKGIDHMEDYLDNWENIESMVLGKLKSRGGITFKDGVKSRDLTSDNQNNEDNFRDNNKISADNGERVMSSYGDDFSITLDSKDTLSLRLKLFLSSVESGDKHYLTKENLHESFDTVYNTLSAMLEGEQPSFENMILKLQDYSNSHKWVDSLIQKLTDSSLDPTIQKEFVTAMNKHFIDMEFIKWSKAFDGSYKINVWNDNANSINQTIKDDWKNSLLNSDLVNVDSLGNQSFNINEVNNILDGHNELRGFNYYMNHQSELNQNEVKRLLNSVGVNISYETARQLMDDGLKVSNNRQFKINAPSGYSEMFSENGFSPIYNIVKKLREIKSESGKVEGDLDLENSSKFDWLSDSSLKSIIDLESKNTNHLLSNSFISGNKRIFSYTNDKFLTDRYFDLMRGFKNGDFKTLNELDTDIYSNNSWWLELLNNSRNSENEDDKLMSNIFKFNYLSLSPLSQTGRERTDRSLSDLSPKEVLLTKLSLFHNNNTVYNKNSRIGRFFYQTMSDKTSMLTLQTLLRNDIKYEGETNNKSIDNDSVDFIYDKIVKSEINRMYEIQKATNNYKVTTNISGYDEGSKYFYTIPRLNGMDSLFKDVDGKRILKQELNSEDINSIKDVIKLSMNELIEQQIQQFKDLGIGYDGKNTNFIDKDAIKYMSTQTESNHPQDISDSIAADFAVNYFISNANIQQLFVGDHSNYFKESKYSNEFKANPIGYAHLAVQETFDNLGKRLAADNAPGYEADYGDKKFIRVSTSSDSKNIPSLSKKYIDNVFNLNKENRTRQEKEATKKYSEINSTDAQAWSSLDFFIDTMHSFGSKYIDNNTYKTLKNKISQARKNNVDVEFNPDELKLIFQPIKPVYANNNQEPIGDTGKTIGVRNYVKISSFPLIPQLIRNSELETIMRHMDANKIDMHVFESGYKVGIPSATFNDNKNIINNEKLSIFNKDGSVNSDNVQLLNANVKELPVQGFKIQQDIPYHDEPGSSPRGTQESKMLFSNIKHIDGFYYGKGEDGKPIKMTGAALEQKYNDIYHEIYRGERDKLRKEFYTPASENNPESVNLKALQKILLDEANLRNYSVNDMIGLGLDENTGKFNFPLWSLPAAHKYESLIMSIVDNRVRRIKLPGNSFVLGSEAGFSFKTAIKDDEKSFKEVMQKYQDQIIFTDHFDHTVGKLLPTREDSNDKSKMLGDQVFIPIKFKAKNGEFIDLMKYTKKQTFTLSDGTTQDRLVIDNNRLPKDLLKLFGFRIPTQGHNSMASIEISGFLPEVCGDLMIAPKDFTVRMGSDFDVDKLFTYNYLTKEVLKDGGISKRIKEINSELKQMDLDFTDNTENENYSSQSLDELLKSLAPTTDKQIELKRELSNLKSRIDVLKENPDNYKIVKDNKGKNYNDLLDIHLEVFENNNQELYQSILSPNGFGDLKTSKTTGLAFDIEKIKNKINGEPLNYMSAQYQQQKFFNGVAGKDGISVFSSSAMFNAISQEKGLKYVDRYVDQNGKVNDRFKIKFGDLESNGDLSNPRTLDKSKLKAKVIEAFQSASVDNENEQILYKLNINQHTFNAINALAMLGFDENVISYFINQPSVIEYVNKSMDKGSSLSEFNPDMNRDVVDGMMEDYANKYNIGNTNVESNRADIGVDEMHKQIDTELNARDSDYWKIQMAVLQKLKTLNEVGQSLQSLMQTVNSESQGFGKSLIGSAETENKVNDIDDVTNKYNLNKNAKGIYNAENVINDENGKPNSLSGFVVNYGLKELNQLTRDLFPYQSKVLGSIFDELSDITGKKSSATSQIEEFKQDAFTGIKSYLFSRPELLNIQNTENERKRLFIDEYDDKGYIIGKTLSLPRTIDAIQKTSYGIQNKLISSFYTQNRKNSPVSILKYRAANGINLDESDIHQAFIDMFKFPTDIQYKVEKNNGILKSYETKTINSRDLALDLIKYTYLSGGIQEAIQFTRYIPIEILMNLGFNDKLSSINFNNPGNFGTELGRNGEIEKSTYIEQYMQHNPSKTQIKIKNNYSNEIDAKSSKDAGMEVIEKDDNGLILAFKPNPKTGDYFLNNSNYNGVAKLYKYVSVRGKDGWQLYKAIDDEYHLIPTLGTFGMNEYNSQIDGVAKSIIPTNNKMSSLIASGIKVSDGLNINDLSGNIKDIYNLSEASTTDNPIESTLQMITDKGNDESKSIANELLKNESLLDFMKDYQISYDDNLSSLGRHHWGGDSKELSYVKINGIKNESKNKLEETIIHEIIHAYTARTIDKIESGNFDGITDNISNEYNKINSIRRALIYKTKSENPEKYKDTLEKLENEGRNRAIPLTPYEKNVYFLESNTEFVSGALTNSDFRDNVLNKKIGETSVLKQLWDSLLKFLGLDSINDINKEYVKNHIFNFIGETDKAIKSKQIQEQSPKESLDIKLAQDGIKLDEIFNEPKDLTNKVVDNPEKSSTLAKNNEINFTEDQSAGNIYRERTIKNASADATIALATDFNSAGERLTKSSVLFQKKKYIPIDTNSLDISDKLINSIIDNLNKTGKSVDLFNGEKSNITLNIAGNGIYTIKGKYTQKQIDDYTYNLLKQVISNPNLNVNIESIRSGGQTGFDEAGIKAANKLGIKSEILAPRGWVFRNVDGVDIHSEQKFKERFNNETQENPMSNIKLDLSDNELSLLKNKYGEESDRIYKSLTDSQKELIIKCL